MSKSVIAMLIMLVVLAAALIIPLTQMSRWDPALQHGELPTAPDGGQDEQAQAAAPGEPRPIATLDNAMQLQSEFNADDGRPRFLAILAPSDQSCRYAAEAMEQCILEEHPELDVSVLIVWVQLDPLDTYESAREASGLLQDPRARQFYGGANAAAYVADTLGYPGMNAWNIVLEFPETAHWEPELPQPMWYVHQLGADHWLGGEFFAQGLSLRNALSARSAELAGWSL